MHSSDVTTGVPVTMVPLALITSVLLCAMFRGSLSESSTASGVTELTEGCRSLAGDQG